MKTTIRKICLGISLAVITMENALKKLKIKADQIDQFVSLENQAQNNINEFHQANLKIAKEKYLELCRTNKKLLPQIPIDFKTRLERGLHKDPIVEHIAIKAIANDVIYRLISSIEDTKILFYIQNENAFFRQRKSLIFKEIQTLLISYGLQNYIIVGDEKVYIKDRENTHYFEMRLEHKKDNDPRIKILEDVVFNDEQKRKEEKAQRLQALAHKLDTIASTIIQKLLLNEKEESVLMAHIVRDNSLIATEKSMIWNAIRKKIKELSKQGVDIDNIVIGESTIFLKGKKTTHYFRIYSSYAQGLNPDITIL